MTGWLTFTLLRPLRDFPGKDDWKKELVNGSNWLMIKGLKPGTPYRVRVVARDPTDPTVHSTDEVLVAMPGEAACLRVDVLVHFILCFFVVTYSFYRSITVYHIWTQQVTILVLAMDACFLKLVFFGY